MYFLLNIFNLRLSEPTDVEPKDQDSVKRWSVCTGSAYWMNEEGPRQGEDEEGVPPREKHNSTSLPVAPSTPGSP